MKQRINTVLALALLATAAVSCRNTKEFVVNGEVKNAKNIKKVYLYQADSVQMNKIDSTILNDKSEFIFKRIAQEASLYKLQVGDAYFDFIAKNGDAIDFSTDWADTTRNYAIKGSDDSEKLKELNTINQKYNGQTTGLIAEYQKAMQAAPTKGDSLNAVFVPRMNVILKGFGDEILKFMDENKNSLAGFYAAYTLDPNEYEPQLIKYAESVKDKFPGNPTVRAFINHMEAVKPVAVGATAPDFTMPGVNGKPVKLADFRGKYLLIDFWASWCGPCRQENPNVVKAFNQYKDKGFTILGVSLDESEGAWKNAIKADGLDWAHASELKRFNGPVVEQYQVQAIPTNFLLDKDGKIVAKNLRGPALEEFLQKTLGQPN
ncbi:MAG: AhpC/TSA family protein [Mucilaginibacter polytrichastri]|nr:AhpC/TSA family protein [Mucilaginibacter polytrichastri]